MFLKRPLPEGTLKYVLVNSQLAEYRPQSELQQFLLQYQLQQFDFSLDKIFLIFGELIASFGGGVQPIQDNNWQSLVRNHYLTPNLARMGFLPFIKLPTEVSDRVKRLTKDSRIFRLFLDLSKKKKDEWLEAFTNPSRVSCPSVDSSKAPKEVFPVWWVPFPSGQEGFFSTQSKVPSQSLDMQPNLIIPNDVSYPIKHKNDLQAQGKCSRDESHVVDSESYIYGGFEVETVGPRFGAKRARTEPDIQELPYIPAIPPMSPLLFDSPINSAGFGSDDDVPFLSMSPLSFFNLATGDNPNDELDNELYGPVI